MPRSKICMTHLFIIVLAGLCLLSAPAAQAQGADKIPPRVMEALKAKFPTVEIHTWTREREGDIVVYDIEFSHEGLKFEADVKEDGTIHNWERQVSVSALPGAARKAVETMYPKADLKQIMAITAVNNGQETLEGYEIVLETVGKKEVEVTFAPDGKFRESSE